VADQQTLAQSLSVVDQVALVCGLVFFVIGLIVRGLRKGFNELLAASELGPLIGLTMAAFAIPKAVYLIYCGFRPELLPQIKDLSVQIVVAGLSALFLAVVGIKVALSDNNTTPPPTKTSASDSTRTSTE
jgi:hypothetical protein